MAIPPLFSGLQFCQLWFDAVVGITAEERVEKHLCGVQYARNAIRVAPGLKFQCSRFFRRIKFREGLFLSDPAFAVVQLLQSF